MVERILTPQQEKWLAAVRERLGALQSALAQFQAPPDDDATLRESVRRLDELFSLVVVGEFNSGKSAFVNAVLGQQVLEEGVVPTTTRIQILQYGDQAGVEVVDEATQVITAPVPFLRDISIVDTPGTNAIERHHEAITEHFVPRADSILFVTSADRPFTESERAFLERIREWGKKVVLVINKIDILETSEELARVESFVSESSRKFLGVEPQTFPVSARQAMRAKQAGDAEALAKSRFEQLEKYIVETLDNDERVRLKLLNPLGVGRRLSTKYLTAIGERRELLRDDVATIEEIQGQFKIYREDLTQGFRLRLSEVDNVLHEFESRGHEFIEETVRLGRVFDLINRDKVKADFEDRVVADAPQRIEERVEGIIDWLVSSDLQQWQFVRDRLARRRTEHSERAMGELGTRFDYDRARLIDTVGGAAQRTFETYDQRREAARMAESVQNAVANTALLEVGAVGLGTAVSLIATSTAVDVTGILAAGVMATIGFLVIPQKRRSAKRELRQKISHLREQLMTALTDQFEREAERSLGRLSDGIAPYTRFVRAEQQSLDERQERFSEIQQALKTLTAEIEHSTPRTTGSDH